MITLTEIFIIYLACGAPFGVHRFLQNRHELVSFKTIFKSLLTVFVWIPYAVRLIYTSVAKKNSGGRLENISPAQTDLQKKLMRLEKEIVSTGEKGNVSIFELREIFERYTGLTQALKTQTNEISEYAIHNLTAHPNKIIGGKCLNRRNRLRLELHQNLASRDFLSFFSKTDLLKSKNVTDAALNLVEQLNDFETLRNLRLIANKNKQNPKQISVKTSEQDLWNTKQHQTLSAEQISTL